MESSTTHGHTQVFEKPTVELDERESETSGEEDGVISFKTKLAIFVS
jgi:hypothetical protein